jgi:hypothetical protein
MVGALRHLYFHQLDGRYPVKTGCDIGDSFAVCWIAFPASLFNQFVGVSPIGFIKPTDKSSQCPRIMLKRFTPCQRSAARRTIAPAVETEHRPRVESRKAKYDGRL